MTHARVRLWHGLLMLPLMAASLALAAPMETPSEPPATVSPSASKPRPAAAKDTGDKPSSGDRLDPQAVDRGASYPGPRRRVFPAE